MQNYFSGDIKTHLCVEHSFSLSWVNECLLVYTDTISPLFLHLLKSEVAGQRCRSHVGGLWVCLVGVGAPYRPLTPGSVWLGSWDTCVFHAGKKHVCLYHHISGEVCEVTLWVGAHAICCARFSSTAPLQTHRDLLHFFVLDIFVLCNKCKDLVSFSTQVFQLLVEAEWGGKNWVKVSHCVFLSWRTPVSQTFKGPTKKTLNPLFFNKKTAIEASANMKNQIETFCQNLKSLSTMSPVVFSVLQEAPRIAVLVHALVQDMKYKPIMLNLKQLFPALKPSLLTFLTASCVFSNTFLCLHFLSFRFLSLHSSRLHLCESKWEAKRGFFAPRIKTRGPLKPWRNTFLNGAWICFISGRTYFITYCMYMNPLQAVACICRFIATTEMGVVWITPIFQVFFFPSAFILPSCLGTNVSSSLFCCQFTV